MRIVLVMLHLALLGAVYLLIAVPALAIFFGGLFFLVTETETALATGAFIVAEPLIAWLGTWLPRVGASAGGGSLVASVASGAVSAGTVLFWVGVAWLATVFINLVFAMIAPYHGLYARMRRWGQAVSLIGLVPYLIPQVLFLFLLLWYMLTDMQPSEAGMVMSVMVVAGLLFLIFDSYFVVTYYLFRSMPEKPDIDQALSKMPAAHMMLWAVFALVFSPAVFVTGLLFPLGGAFFGIASLAAIVLFIANARSVSWAAAGIRRAATLSLILTDIVLTVIFLVILPPLGVALLLSTALVYFSLEMTLWRRFGKDAAEAGDHETKENQTEMVTTP